MLTAERGCPGAAPPAPVDGAASARRLRCVEAKLDEVQTSDSARFLGKRCAPAWHRTGAVAPSLSIPRAGAVAMSCGCRPREVTAPAIIPFPWANDGGGRSRWRCGGGGTVSSGVGTCRKPSTSWWGRGPLAGQASPRHHTQHAHQQGHRRHGMCQQIPQSLCPTADA